MFTIRPVPTLAKNLDGDLLVLVSISVLAPFSQGFVSALNETINRVAPDVRIHVEVLPDEPDVAVLEQWFQQRLSGRTFDAMVMLSMVSPDEVLRASRKLWPEVPLFAVSSDCGLRDASPSSQAWTPLCFGDTTEPTLDLAFALFPSTRHIAVSGTSLTDDPWRPRLTRTLARRSDQANLIDLTGLGLEELRTAMVNLPSDTILLLGGPSADPNGRWIYPRRVLQALQEVSRIPVFSDNGALFGQGTVGGTLVESDALGHEAALSVVQRLRVGENAALKEMPLTTKVDWRALSEYDVSEAALPEGVELVFREPSLWERYRWLVLITCLVLITQTAIVVRLVMERSRRRQAELQALKRLSELAHLNRLGAVSQLSLSLAHEINQPLGAILSSAQTCEVLLTQPTPHWHDLHVHVKRIVEANRLASRIVRGLRELTHKPTLEHVTIELDPWVRDTTALLSRDAQLRGVSCVLSLQAPHAFIQGDRIQLQQVLINLTLNALEAMQEPGTRVLQLSVSTHRLDRTHVCVRLDDGGPGLPSPEPEAVFEPFFSTKQQGLGLGLGIARELVHVHGGTLHGSNLPGGGARFELVLPLTNDAPAGGP